MVDLLALFLNLRIRPKDKTPDPNMVGLYNLGNTCYFNAALQMLAHCRPLVRHVLSSSHTVDPSSVSDLLRRLFITMWPDVGNDEDKNDEDNDDENEVPARKQPDMTVSPSVLLRAIMGKSTMFERYRQGDAHEMTSRILDLLTERNETPTLKRVVEGSCVSIVTCSSCGASSRSAEDPFTSLLVALPAPRSTASTSNDLVRTFFGSTTAEGWRCDACGSVGMGKVATRLWNIPRVLLVCIKRFATDGCVVDHTPVIPSKRLDLLVHSNTAMLAPNSPARELVLQRRNSKRRGFRLVGTVCHFGSSQSSGHYVACCRRSGSYGGGWWVHDDTSVLPLHGGVTDVPTGQVYMLAYEMVCWDENTPARDA